MADYKYSYDLDDGAGGYLKYNLSSNKIAIGDVLEISGVICSMAHSVVKLSFDYRVSVMTHLGQNDDYPAFNSGVIKINAKKGVEKAFSAQIVIMDAYSYYDDELIRPLSQAGRGSYIKAKCLVIYSNDDYNYTRFTVASLINLVYHTNLRLLAFDVGRCNYWGEWDAQGTYLRVKAFKLSCDPRTPTTKISITGFRLTKDNGEFQEDLGFGGGTPADQKFFTDEGYSESESEYGSLFSYTLDGTTGATLSLTFSDGYETWTFDTAKIPPAFARLHLSGAAKGGVAVGMFSSATDDQPKFEVAENHTSHFYGPVEFHGGTLGADGDYVSGEVFTGSFWIDGHPIYRYVAHFTSKTGGPTISGINEMISMYGAVKNNANSRWMPLPMTSTSVSNQVQIYIESNGKITIETDNKNFTTGPYIVIVEYTKN